MFLDWIRDKIYAKVTKVDATFAITKVAGRIRKTPVVQSSLVSRGLTFGSNVVATVPAGMVAGITFGEAPVMDTTSGVWFIPIKVILSDNTTATAYIAASNVDLLDKRPDEVKVYQVKKSSYDSAATPTSGLSGSDNDFSNLI